MVASKKGSDDDSHQLKSDITEEELKRLYAKASTQRFDENPRYPCHFSAGVMPMAIKGRFANERERLGPDFNETQRQWRIKWIRDQHLHPSEPFEVKQLYLEYYNPIRRFYRKPLDLFEAFLAKHKSRDFACNTRKVIGRGFLIYLSVLGVWYYLKYNRENWEKERGVRIKLQRENIYPGDPTFPQSNPRTESWQHWDRGFQNRNVLKNKE